MKAAHLAWTGFAVVTILSGCNLLAGATAEGLCKKEFECQDELQIELEDDYVQVCKLERENLDESQRKNAEPDCAKLADAQVSLHACLNLLDCKKLFDYRSNPASTHCKDQRAELKAKLDATDAGNDCAHIALPYP